MTTTKSIAGLFIFGVLALPVLALAQADNEGAEGSCNDEMSESAGCGAAGAGSSYASPSTYTYSSPTSYSYPSQQYYSANSYAPSYQQTYQAYAPSYASYAPANAYNYGTLGNSLGQAYANAASYAYQPYTSNGYGYSSYAPSQYATGYAPTYNNSYQFSTQRYLSAPPQTYSIPTGTYSWGNQLCYWSDYQGLTPCGSDPQQWVYDPYTGTWY